VICRGASSSEVEQKLVHQYMELGASSKWFGVITMEQVGNFVANNRHQKSQQSTEIAFYYSQCHNFVLLFPAG
jgi:hypothetical protein